MARSWLLKARRVLGQRADAATFLSTMLVSAACISTGDVVQIGRIRATWSRTIASGESSRMASVAS